MYSESFTIRASEVDQQGKATLAALAALLQEVAGNHASTLQFDITDLQKDNLTWVLHRMDIKVDRYPEWRETIKIETWPNAGDTLRAYRDYKVTDENGNVILLCLSYWMIMNMKSRRPSRIPKEILELRLTDKDHVLNVKSDRPDPIDEYDYRSDINVRRSDLDMNQHVNNARYLEWVVEPMPADYAQKIRRADIVFMKECVLGDTITSEVTISGGKTNQHRLVDQNDKLIAIAELS